MHHIVYVSRATRPFGPDDAQHVLTEARAFNEEHGVTGLLVHAEAGAFFQVLEGEVSAVEAAYRRAAASDRHDQVLRTPAFEVPARVFPAWSMGFERALPGQLVEQVLEPLVRHQLVEGDLVRAVLLQRWGVLQAV